MHRWLRIALAALLPFLLTGCFLSPGRFTAALDLRRDGHFTYRYQGEMAFFTPPDPSTATAPWEDAQAHCQADKPDKQGDFPERPCTPSEIASQRADYEATARATAERRRAETQRYAQLFGYVPGDDAANRRLAERIARLDGFRSATYAGRGVFVVDYQKSGQLDYDYVFPATLGQVVTVPFTALRLERTATGGRAVRVMAPAFRGGGSVEALAAMGDKAVELPPDTAKLDGTFTLTTDGEVLTNNTEDGATATDRDRQLAWRVTTDRKVAPEALVGLR